MNVDPKLIDALHKAGLNGFTLIAAVCAIVFVWRMPVLITSISGFVDAYRKRTTETELARKKITDAAERRRIGVKPVDKGPG